MSPRLALLIGNTYPETIGFAPLVAPKADVEALTKILRDPDIGAFDEVQPLIDMSTSEMGVKIQLFFNKKASEDQWNENAR